MKFRRFSFEFKDAYAPENVGKEGMKVTFDYESYADYSAGGEMTYKNTSKFCDVDANAEFKSKKDVKSKLQKQMVKEWHPILRSRLRIKIMMEL